MALADCSSPRGIRKTCPVAQRAPRRKPGAAGIAVEPDPQLYPNDRFARLHDPERNPIEPWEPAGPGAPASS